MPIPPLSRILGGPKAAAPPPDDMSLGAIHTRRELLVQELASIADKARENLSSLPELLDLNPGEVFIPFNHKFGQPYCNRILTADARRNLVAYGIGVAPDGSVKLLTAPAFGSCWTTIITERMECWHYERGEFRYNPKASTFSTADELKGFCVIEFVVRILRAKASGSYLLIPNGYAQPS